MSRTRWLVALGLLATLTLTASAQTPGSGTSPDRRSKTPQWSRPYRPAVAEAPVSADARALVEELGHHQVMARQIGFEPQQQAYAAKVQGAASQNIHWVKPEALPPARRGTSLAVLLGEFFASWD